MCVVAGPAADARAAGGVSAITRPNWSESRVSRADLSHLAVGAALEHGATRPPAQLSAVRQLLPLQLLQTHQQLRQLRL